MFHCMTVKIPVKGTIFSYRMTFTNETTGYYYDMGEKGMDNHQFSFPNMDVEGRFTINGKTHVIKNTTAWFDRQWGVADTSDQLTKGKGMDRLSWLWIGFPMGEKRDRYGFLEIIGDVCGEA